ncbi:MAG: Zn-dependent M28 family amino/carboxypeptidase [Paraglaciecola sp.]
MKIGGWLYCLLCIGQCSSSFADCLNTRGSNKLDATLLWQDISALADDHMQGRKTASQGAELARLYISRRYQQIGLQAFPTLAEPSEPAYISSFKVTRGWSEVGGSNVLGWLGGRKYQDRYIVVTAHYDHLGKSTRGIFNGADDNASGVAAMLGIAQYMAQYGSQYSIIFVATDAEEKGLFGAKGFLAKPPVPLGSIIANLNLDMLGEGGRRGRLYVTPSRGETAWEEMIQGVIASGNSCLVKGHRSNRRHLQHQNINWRKSSDHAAFASKNIPYLFVGVADHSRYHSENDTTDRIKPVFFTYAAQTALTLLLKLDALVNDNQATPSSLSRSAK